MNAKTAADIELLCNLPGPNGVLWRLIREWNPDGITKWLVSENLLGTDPMLLAQTMGTMFATVAFTLGTNLERGHGINPRTAIEKGLIASFERELQRRIHEAHRTPGGIITPSSVVAGQA